MRQTMSNNNNFSPLPFYGDIKHQNHRKTYSQGIIYQLITQQRMILPFQIVRESRHNKQITNVLLMHINGSEVSNITRAMLDNGLCIKSFDEYDIIIYNGTLPIVVNMPIGMYYLRMTDGVETWYSEVFNAVDDVRHLLKLEYWNDGNISYGDGEIDFTHPYRGVFYFSSVLCKPTYEMEEEGEVRDGIMFIEKQVSKKTHIFNILVPEYICDALRVMQLCDNVVVSYDGKKYSARNTLISLTWESVTLASVDIEFEDSTIIKKIPSYRLMSDVKSFSNDFDTNSFM